MTFYIIGNNFFIIGMVYLIKHKVASGKAAKAAHFSMVIDIAG
jgi:hypothetical protein